jgi:acyl-CoA thioesterase-2
MAFAEIAAVEQLRPDRFVARGPEYPWGGIYGGQQAAQALRAAAATVDPSFAPLSLRACYVAGGSSGEPLELEVDRVRDGRSFSVRAVAVRQGGRLLSNVLVCFHVRESVEQLDRGRMPAAPAPDELEPAGWCSTFDLRYAPSLEPGRVLAWMRIVDSIAADPALHACALAFLADDIPDDAALALLAPERPPSPDLECRDPSISTHSLDYGIWFHRPGATDGWLLHDFRCSTLANACAMVTGEVFDAAGTHVATVASQVLVRRLS